VLCRALVELFLCGDDFVFRVIEIVDEAFARAFV